VILIWTAACVVVCASALLTAGLTSASSSLGRRVILAEGNVKRVELFLDRSV
jgi:hypothetical protein